MSFINGCETTNCPQPPIINSINTYLINHNLRLGKVIGEGSYSKVRLCTIKPPDGKESSIACKVINKKKASGDFVNKFLPRELQIVTQLSNPNIISVFDVVEFDQNVFIFMDYCNKGDLLEFVKRKGFLSERRSQEYFRQILSAVRYLHGLDLAHRDLKCENILLLQNDVVKISDFGFARYCRDSVTGKRILSNTYCGSAAYAAPEILQGTMYNPKLYDMWSLGCILFIMLTGHMPYDESNVQKMLKNQIERVLTYPHQVHGSISKYAKRLIRHLLEPDVTRRATIEQAVSNNWFSAMKKSSPVSQNSSDGSITTTTDGGSGDFLTAESSSETPCSTTAMGVVEVKMKNEIIPEENGVKCIRPPSSRVTSSKPYTLPHQNAIIESRNVTTADGHYKQSYKQGHKTAAENGRHSGRNDYVVRSQPQPLDQTRLPGVNIPRTSNYKCPKSQPKLT